ncbi:VOC family protein [Zavarzinia sp.]|uniref:VOC family protein n=1 Tax=Zavarzinia sp. TaxID=2027920 RepID=UPI00356336E1
MARLNGIHHIAVMAGNIKQHIEFFADVLGCRLEAIFPMHGVPGAFHAFLHLNDQCHFSLVEIPGTREIPIELGRSHAGNGARASAPGTMQHLAFRVADETALLAFRDRIRRRGIPVFGPIDHGLCRSIYFAGPDQLSLEIATSAAPIDPRAWIDPVTLAAAGITPEEAARYAAPADEAGSGGSVPQPAYDPAKPHQAFPKAMYQQMLAMSDEAIAAAGSHPEPPVAP